MKSIILLHGALGSDRQMQPLQQRLSESFDVHLLCFEGHGERTTDRDLSIAYFSENLKVFIEEKKLKQPLVFGYSMGGYVALYMEAKHPGALSGIITLGTKFLWTPDIAAREVRMLQPDLVEEKVPKFAAHLSRMHAPNDWKENMKNTATMMEEMGNNPPMNAVDLSKVNSPVQLLLGTKDTMVTEAETRAILEQLPNARLDMLTGVEHPIEKLDLMLLDGYLDWGSEE